MEKPIGTDGTTQDDAPDTKDTMGRKLLHCNQCDHTWAMKKETYPQRCPSCRSQDWNLPKFHKNTCIRCGYKWKSRVDDPARCPSCHSTLWNVLAYRFQCNRCGYKWMPRGSRSSDEVRICPSCKSVKWNEPKDPDTGVQSPEETGTVRCGFCLTVSDVQRIRRDMCPYCGRELSSGKDRASTIWKDRSMEMVYISADGYSAVALWRDGVPVAADYLDRVLSKLKMGKTQFEENVGSATLDIKLRKIAKDMFRHKDDCLDYVPYFIEKLGLNEMESTILAYHFTGFGPELLSKKFDIPMNEIRSMFDRIMAAYSEKGIVVNDRIFTRDPFAHYR